MSVITDIWEGAKTGGLSAIGEQGNTLADKASSAINQFLSKLKLPEFEVQTDNNIKADHSVFLLVAAVGVVFYFIFKKH